MSFTSTENSTETQQARFNMMEQQIRPWDVLDQRLLDLIHTTPRELFITPEYKNLAYADITVPIDHDQIMFEPRIDARLLQALEVSSLDNILEIGTGTGYTTALLAQLGRSVTSVDLYDDFLDQAAFRLKSLDLHNVSLLQGCAANGWVQASDYEYDVILISGTMPVLPESFKHIMNRGGRLVFFTGTEPTMEATLIRRMGTQDWHRKTLFEYNAPMLINCKRSSTFTF